MYKVTHKFDQSFADEKTVRQWFKMRWRYVIKEKKSEDIECYWQKWIYDYCDSDDGWINGWIEEEMIKRVSWMFGEEGNSRIEFPLMILAKGCVPSTAWWCFFFFVAIMASVFYLSVMYCSFCASISFKMVTWQTFLRIRNACDSPFIRRRKPFVRFCNQRCRGSKNQMNVNFKTNGQNIKRWMLFFDKINRYQ